MYIRRSNLNVAVQYLFVITFILAFVFVPNKEENIKATNLVLVLDQVMVVATREQYTTTTVSPLKKPNWI